MAEPFWILVGILVSLVLSAVSVGVWQRAPGRQRDRLRTRFGPEYDRAVEETGSGKAARRELRRRVRRIDRMHLRPLSAEEQARFAGIWDDLRAAFTDDPTRSVLDAGRLLKEVMRTEGYPTEGFQQQASDLSVHHPHGVHHYRAAHTLTRRAATGRASTDELRRALIHYNVLFAELLSAPERARRPVVKAHPATSA